MYDWTGLMEDSNVVSEAAKTEIWEQKSVCRLTLLRASWRSSMKPDVAGKIKLFIYKKFKSLIHIKTTKERGPVVLFKSNKQMEPKEVLRYKLQQTFNKIKPHYLTLTLPKAQKPARPRSESDSSGRLFKGLQHGPVGCLCKQLITTHVYSKSS